MLTEEELTAIRDENELQKEMHVSRWSCVRADSATIDRLLTEVRELRALLRDAVQDDTPGNRLWREGVKAGLEAGAKAADNSDHTCMTMPGNTEGHPGDAIKAQQRIVAAISAIDPAAILPPR